MLNDISKCQGQKCPLREKCKRYTCESVEWQAWSDFDSLLDGDCEYYLTNEKCTD